MEQGQLSTKEDCTPQKLYVQGISQESGVLQSHCEFIPSRKLQKQNDLIDLLSEVPLPCAKHSCQVFDPSWYIRPHLKTCYYFAPVYYNSGI